MQQPAKDCESTSFIVSRFYFTPCCQSAEIASPAYGTEGLPILEQREALVIGDSVPVPTIVKVGHVERTPDSKDIKVLTEWRNNWRDLPFGKVLEGMKRH